MTKQDIIDELTTVVNESVGNTGTLNQDEIEIATYAAYEYLKTVNPNLPARPRD